MFEPIALAVHLQDMDMVGEPVQILDESFSSEEACEHAIFLKRIADLMSAYS